MGSHTNALKKPFYVTIFDSTKRFFNKKNLVLEGVTGVTFHNFKFLNLFQEILGPHLEIILSFLAAWIANWKISAENM